MEREKSERQQMIEDYLLQQKQHNNPLDQVNNSEAEPEPMRLVAEDQQQLTTETNKSCHKINIVQCEHIPIETISQTKDNQCFNYHALNQADIFEDYKESFSPTLSESLLIPEINLVAATPKENSPCISPKQVGKKDIKNEDENGMNKLDYTITDEDWDRMEAIAEQERLEDIETSQEEIDENRRKLNEFRQNPKVEISRSRLADELALILEEAKKRIEDDKGIKIKKNKKRPKEVTFKHPQSFDDSKAAPDTVKDMIKKVDKERINDIEDDGIEIDDSSLLNGFMDGFEDEDKGKELTVSKVNGKRKLMTKAGIACLVAFGAAILINKIRQ